MYFVFDRIILGRLCEGYSEYLLYEIYMFDLLIIFLWVGNIILDKCYLLVLFNLFV